jgi:uncharacterized membrane protein (DUF373 family)
MSKSFRHLNIKNNLEIILASSLFLVALYYTMTNNSHTVGLSFPVIVGFGLYFLVFLEISRAILDFIFDSEHRIKVKYIFDGGIIFVVREILVSSTLNHSTIMHEIPYLIVMFVILVTLSSLRYIDYKYNPRENCS